MSKYRLIYAKFDGEPRPERGFLFPLLVFRKSSWRRARDWIRLPRPASAVVAWLIAISSRHSVIDDLIIRFSSPQSFFPTDSAPFAQRLRLLVKKEAEKTCRERGPQTQPALAEGDLFYFCFGRPKDGCSLSTGRDSRPSPICCAQPASHFAAALLSRHSFPAFALDLATSCWLHLSLVPPYTIFCAIRQRGPR